MRVIGIILLLIGLVLLGVSNSEPSGGTWKAYESDLKNIEFAEDAYLPCLCLGGLFLGLGIFLDSKKPNKYTCNKCGAEVQENQEFCSKCGSRLMYKCPYCGELHEELPSFCKGCGAHFSHICSECSTILKDGDTVCPLCGKAL